MFDAQTLTVRGVSTTTVTTTVFSPWFPRGGDYGLFTLEVIKFSDGSASSSLKVEMTHKNSSDPGNGDDIGSSANTINGDATTLRVTKNMDTNVSLFTGFKELVRYKFTFTRTSSTTDVSYWAMFRMLPPVWYDRV